MLSVDAGFSLLEKCKTLKATKGTAIMLSGAILKGEFLLLLFKPSIQGYKIRWYKGLSERREMHLHHRFFAPQTAICIFYRVILFSGWFF